MPDEQHGLTRSSVDCVQEEEEMEMNHADEEALNTMCRYRTFNPFSNFRVICTFLPSFLALLDTFLSLLIISPYESLP